MYQDRTEWYINHYAGGGKKKQEKNRSNASKYRFKMSFWKESEITVLLRGDFTWEWDGRHIQNN